MACYRWKFAFKRMAREAQQFMSLTQSYTDRDFKFSWYFSIHVDPVLGVPASCGSGLFVTKLEEHAATIFMVQVTKGTNRRDTCVYWLAISH